MKKCLLILVSVFMISNSVMSQNIDAIVSSLTTDKQKADTLFSFGRRYLQRGKFDSSLYWLDKGMVYALQTGVDELIAKYYIEQSTAVSFGNENAKALSIIAKAKPYLEMTTDYRLHNNYLMLTGKFHRGLNKTDSALYYFQLCEQLNNRENLYRNWLVYLETALLYQYTDSYPESEKYFQKAYAITKAKGIRMDHGVVINQFADFYYQSNQPEKFAVILKEHDEFVQGIKKDYSKDPVHSMLFIDWQKAPLDTKVDFMKKVKEELLSGGFRLNAALANNYIAIFYEQAGQPDEAVKYIRENLKLSMLENNINNLYINTKVEYRLLKKAGRTLEANETADRLFSLKDSIIKIQQRELAFDMETKYQTEKKEKEIILLNSQKELDANAIALLNTQNKLSAFELLREMDLKSALMRENTLMDSIVGQERTNNELLTNENLLKKSELEKEQALTAAINRENSLKANKLSKEKNIRSLLIGSVSLLLLAAGIILYQYRKQRIKNLVIQKQADDMQVLMKEIHHRVKNNLQVISSLLDLQSMTIADSQASEAVKEGKNRVQSMALIHQNLYSEGNIKGIRTKEYISNLLQSLCDSYNITNEKVRVKTQIDDLNLDVDTMIPLGLVLNELVSNSLKYAFKDGRQGELSIILKEEAQHLLLKVSDNGKGYPEGMNTKDSKSFGMKMIRAFAQKLKAKLDIYNNNGAVVEMQITKYNLA